MTVAEYAKQTQHSKLWLCPNLVVDSKIGLDMIRCGIECTAGTIPDEIKDKEVIKHFYDTGTDCIIWKNVEEEGPQGMVIAPTNVRMMQLKGE